MATHNYISAIERTMRVVEAFRGEQQVGLGELASRTGLVKSSAFRILFTLQRLGYVEKAPRGRYSLTSRLGLVVGDHRPSFDLGQLAAPFMASLLRLFQETVNLGVLNDAEVLYIRVLESPHAFRLAAHAGMRSPVHSTALGKCLLTALTRKQVEPILKKRPLEGLTPRTIRNRASFYRELGRVRARGYAVDNEEDSRGARCLGAPILDPAGGVVAALSISGPASRVHPGRDREIAEALMDACGQISKLLGYGAGRSSAPISQTLRP